MADYPHRRRRILVDRRLQIGLSLRIVGYVYLYLVFFALVATGPAIMTVLRGGDDPEFLRAVDRLTVFVQVFVLPLALTFVCMCLHGIVLTHRVAGPIYRFRQVLSGIRRRFLPPKVALREGDCFADLCEEMNGLLEHLRGEIGAIREVSEGLAAEAAALQAEGGLPSDAQVRLVRLANGFTRLRQVVDGYRFEAEPSAASAPEPKAVGAAAGSC